MRERQDELRFWVAYSGFGIVVGAALLIIWALVSTMRRDLVDVLDYLIVLTTLLIGMAVGVKCAAMIVLEDER